MKYCDGIFWSLVGLCWVMKPWVMSQIEGERAWKDRPKTPILVRYYDGISRAIAAAESLQSNELQED